MPADLVRQHGIGIARKQGNRQGSETIILRHRPCSNWLGWKDSNLRMAGSKPAALPLGDTPTWKTTIDELAFAQVRNLSSKGESFIPRAISPANAGGNSRNISRPRS